MQSMLGTKSIAQFQLMQHKSIM